MDSRFWALALLAVAGTGPAQAVERKLLVASFENIQVIGDIDVTVQTGKSPSAIAKGDKRMLESLKLERVGTTLRVRLQDIVNNNKGVPITGPLQVTLTTPGDQGYCGKRQRDSENLRSEAAERVEDGHCRKWFGFDRQADRRPVFCHYQWQWQDRHWRRCYAGRTGDHRWCRLVRRCKNDDAEVAAGAYRQCQFRPRRSRKAPTSTIAGRAISR